MSILEQPSGGMGVTRTHAGTRRAAALADPVVDPDPELPVSLSRPVDPGLAAPVVTPRTVDRTRVAALRAQIEHLEARLEAAERRHDATVERYERILERRTERFREWVRQGDPRPEEFAWIGRSRATAAGSDPRSGSDTDPRFGPDTDFASDPEPDPGRAGGTGSVATDGGRDRSSGTAGLLSRLLGFLRRRG